MLKEKREKQGIEIKHIASKLNVTERTIYYWEQNKSFPKAFDILNVAEVYGLSDEEILDWLREIKK